MSLYVYIHEKRQLWLIGRMLDNLRHQLGPQAPSGAISDLYACEAKLHSAIERLGGMKVPPDQLELHSEQPR